MEMEEAAQDTASDLEKPTRATSWVSPDLVRVQAEPPQEAQEAQEAPEVAEETAAQKCRKFFRTLAMNEVTIIQHKEFHQGKLRTIGVHLNPREYLHKFKGKTLLGPPRLPHPWQILWYFIASFVGIAVVAVLQQYVFAKEDLVLLVGSYGATAVLVYEAPDSPLAQPRNVVLGHFSGALCGTLVRMALGDETLLWLACALAVSSCVVLMALLKCVHPPGGATAILAVIGSEQLKQMGFWFLALAPLGGAVMVGVAVVMDNISTTLRYPQYWC